MADFRKVDSLLETFAEKTIPGCSLTVMRDGEVLYEKQAGFADLEKRIPVDSETIFRHASTTKLFTYAITGMLYEEGKLLLSDPIYEYLPEWKNVNKWVKNPNGTISIVPIDHPITVAEAMAMMCGLPYCMAPNPNPQDLTEAAMSKVMTELLKKGTPTLREEVRGMAAVPVRFDPGTHWLYGFGSEITGAIVEEITGKPLRKVFKERVIDPLQLKHTCTYLTDIEGAKIVRAYAKDEKGQFTDVTEHLDVNLYPETHPEGARVALNSTSADFAVFMQMLAAGGTYKGERLLSPGTIRMLHDNRLSEVQMKDFTCDYLAGYGYGLGFRTLLNQGAGFHNGHLGSFGWTGGFGTWAEADPTTNTSVVYMHNMMPNEELYHHHRVRNAVYAALED